MLITRVARRPQYLMAKYGLPYERVLFGYGAGADPVKCEGQGYPSADSPLKLTGKKMLPVLEGPGVPVAAGATGMPESLEICAFLIAQHKLVVPCASGRGDIDAFNKSLSSLSGPLINTRETRMPIADWADPRDVAYRKWKKKGTAALTSAQEEEAVAGVNAKLLELPGLMRGDGCLNVWGWGMDDVCLLPTLRRLTMIKVRRPHRHRAEPRASRAAEDPSASRMCGRAVGSRQGVTLPEAVRAYVYAFETQLVDYAPHAL
jgi:glutaredoxin 2